MSIQQCFPTFLHEGKPKIILNISKDPYKNVRATVDRSARIILVFPTAGQKFPRCFKGYL